jgi:hypothetical protein
VSENPKPPALRDKLHSKLGTRNSEPGTKRTKGTKEEYGKKTTPQDTPQDTMQDTMQDAMQVKQLIVILKEEMTREELQTSLGIKNRDYFRKYYIIPSLKNELIEMTIPDKPNSKLQKYRLTIKGLEKLKMIKNKENKKR